MSLRFVPITRQTFNEQASMAFEDQYEPELRLSLDEKRELSIMGYDNKTFGFYLFLGNEIIGETHGVQPSIIGSDFAIEDCDPDDTKGVYCYGTTIKAFHQGRGYGKLLKAYWIGYLAARGYKATYGHATSVSMVKLVMSLDADFGTVHENWAGTPRKAVFYTIKL